MMFIRAGLAITNKIWPNINKQMQANLGEWFANIMREEIMTKDELKKLNDAVKVIIDAVPPRKLPSIVGEINTLGLHLDELAIEVDKKTD